MLKSVKLKPILALIVITGGTAVIGWVYQWWHSPAVSTPVALTTSSNVLGSGTSLTPWQTAYFTTQIPSFLRVRNSVENPTRPQLGQYLLANIITSKTDQVAITVGMLGNSTLAEQSSVRLRRAQTTTYQPASRSYVPAGAFVFSRTDSYETAIIWQHDARYVAVVVSGTVDRQPDLEQSLAAIVTNWQWQ